MISINSAHIISGAQTLHSAAKETHLNTPVLQKLDSINNSTLPPPSTSNSLHKSQQTFSEYALPPRINNLSTNENTQKEAPKFKLAEAISHCYPREANPPLNNINRLVVFGDSLSDSEGRMFDKSFHLIPSYEQYYGGRFTNGFVWGEYLSSPAFLKKDLVNYAEGGSTSDSYSPLNLYANILSNLDKQMHHHHPVKGDLNIIFIGSNDYIVLHKENILKIIHHQINNIEKMIKKGADNILVMGIPDLSHTPNSTRKGAQWEHKDITTAHNTLLKNNIEILQKKYPDKKICYFDTSEAFENITKIAKEVGYNTTQPYSEHGYIHFPFEKKADLNIAPPYLFNDKLHPTQEVHQSFATILASFISKHYADPVPDPVS